MADPDRLIELRRQRTLIADHLAWIDRDIATIKESQAPSVPLPLSPPIQRVTTRSTETETGTGTAGQMNEWSGENPVSESLISTTGCWLVFATITLLGIGTVVLFISLNY